MKIKAVLFDLDGTLADTALDLSHALNLQRMRHGLPPLPHETLRPCASHGVPGLFRIGFALSREDESYATMREEYLAIYQANLCNFTRLFDGMGETLDELERRGLPWGVVTNKLTSFTTPLMAALGLNDRAATIVSGDTCPNPKPHPEPLLHASREIGVPAEQIAYVGDAQRDMEAANAAGMYPIVALYGYLGEDDHPAEWQAQGSINAPLELLRLI
jgi:N-acetyl-D-muramate 6-phosphate phosphatase